MERVIPLSWPGLIRKRCTDSPILFGYSHWSLTGQFGVSGSTLHVMDTILGHCALIWIFWQESFQTREKRPTTRSSNLRLVSDKQIIQWYTTKKCSVTILYHAAETNMKNQCDRHAVLSGKVTVK